MLKFNDKLNYEVLEKYGFVKKNEYCYEYELFNCDNVKKHEMDGHVSVLVYTQDAPWISAKKNNVIIWVNYWSCSEEEFEIRECDDAIAFDILFDLIKDGIIVKGRK